MCASARSVLLKPVMRGLTGYIVMSSAPVSGRE